MNPLKRNHRLGILLFLGAAASAAISYATLGNLFAETAGDDCDPSRDPGCAPATQVVDLHTSTAISPTESRNQGGTPNSPEPNPQVECSYVVAQDGDDRAAGSISAPWQTIQAGIDRLEPGDLLCVRAGTYPEVLTIDGTGSADHPITIRAYPGETPVIDGQAGLDGINTGLPLCANGCAASNLAEIDPNSGKGHVWDALVTIRGAHVTFEGFEIKRSMGRGLTITHAQEITIENVAIHHSRSGGILIFTDADQVTIRGCSIWWNGDFAPYSRSPSLDWPVILMVRGRNVTIRDNVVYNNWGEGIGAGRGSESVLIEGNTVYDNYALQIYVDHGQEITISANLVYFSEDPTFYRGGSAPECIALNNEIGFPGHLNKNIMIVNNLVRGCQYNLGLWSQGSLYGVEDLLVAHNTFVEGTSGAMRIAPALLVPHKNVRFKNNLILQANGIPIDLGTWNGISFSSNLWWPMLPAEQAISEGDVNADPNLSLKGSIVSGELLPEYFMFKSADSPAIDAGLVDEDAIEVDYFDFARGPSPDIGAIEWEE